jgi:microsomal dipeptidase-like Zn-dependent dipeptidase
MPSGADAPKGFNRKTTEFQTDPLPSSFVSDTLRLRLLRGIRGATSSGTLAGFPNMVACKISGILANVDPQHWSPEDLRPYFDHLVECFGWDRVMFGSDWPVCALAATFKGWVDAILFLTQTRTESERSRLFSDNARKVYKLDA